MEEKTLPDNIAQIIVREHPLAQPSVHYTKVGFSVSTLKSHLPEHNGLLPQVYINGELVEDSYTVQSQDIIEVDFIPQVDGGITALLSVLLGLAGGYIAAKLFTPDLEQSAPEDVFARIRGLRNSERLYETVPLVLGKRKVAPHYIARPYTTIEGTTEYFHALMSAGYGPLKLENFRIGDVPLNEFEHEIAVLDHYENTSVDAVYRAYSADISQEQVDVELINNKDETPDWSTYSSATDPEQILVDLAFPVGLFRTNQEGKTRLTTVGIDLEMQDELGNWSRVFPSIKSLDGYNGGSNVTVPLPFTIKEGTIFVDDRITTSPPIFYYADEDITQVDIPNDNYLTKVTELTDTSKVRRWVSGSYTSVLGFENPIYSYSAVIDLPSGVTAYSYLRRDIVKRQFFETLRFYPQQEGVVNIRLRKSFVSNYTGEPNESHSTFNTVKIDNIKTTRALSLSQFQKAIGGNRPALRYTDENGVRQTVETFKPTVIALRIKATGQFNGALDNLFCDATMCVPVDKDSDWRNWVNETLEPSTNPADAYKWLLQGSANYSPVPIEKVDHTNLAAWRSRCDTEGWSISALIDYESTLLNELKNVAYLGRAEWSFVDGKFGVVEKIERTIPIQMFTPRNSANFQSTRNYPEEVDGIKFEFDSAEIDYEKDEGTFFDPAKDGNADLLRGRFTRLPMWGVDNYDQAYRLARFEYYERELQREVYTLTTDAESLRCKRGDLVYVQNDTIEVGLGSGRIKAISGSQITLDDYNDVELGDGEQLAITFRDKFGDFYVSDASHLGEGVWDVDDLPESSQVGDLCVYGIKGQEVLECIVKDIKYKEDLTIDLTLVNAANEIFTFDGNPIPEYTPFLRPRIDESNPEAPILYDEVNVDADKGVISLALVNSDLARSQGLSYRVQARTFEDASTKDGLSLDEGWFTVASGLDSELEFTLNNIETGLTYEFRVQARRSATRLSQWSNYVSVTVTTGTTLAAVTNFGFTHAKNGTVVSWDAITSVLLSEYELRTNTNFGEASGLLYKGKGTVYNLGYISTNSTLYIAAINLNGGYGSSASLSVTKPVVGSSSIESIEENTIEWAESNSPYPLRGYNIYIGETSVFGNSEPYGIVADTSYTPDLPESGTYYLFVEPVDVAGNLANITSTSFEYAKPVSDITFNEIQEEINARFSATRDRLRSNTQLYVDEMNSILDVGDTNARVQQFTVSFSSDLENVAGLVTLINSEFDNFSAQVNQEFFAITGPDGAIASAITEVKTEIESPDGTILGGFSGSINDVVTDPAGNSEALAALYAGVTGEGGTADAVLILDSYANEGGLGARAFFGTTVVDGSTARVTGITVNDDGVDRSIQLSAPVISFWNPIAERTDLFWDAVDESLTFRGRLILDDGTPINSANDIKQQNEYTEFRYRRATSQPATPTDLTPSGWSLTVPAGSDPLWFIQARKLSDGSAFVSGETWSTPSRITGEDGTSVVIKGELASTDDLPTPPADPSDAYLISGDLWVWDGTQWINAGQIQGPQGQAGQSTFKSIVFVRQNTTPSAPTGGSYSSPVPSGWSDGVPSGEQQLWQSTRVFTDDGEAPQQANWTTPRALTNTTTTEFQYSEVDENPQDPSAAPANWSTTATVDTLWIAQREKINGTFGSWQVFRAKGERGLTSATVYLYQATTRNASAPALPDETVVYDLDEAEFASGVPVNNWQATIPTGEAVWVTQVSISGIGEFSIGAGLWSAAARLSRDGVDGDNGSAGASFVAGEYETLETGNAEITARFLALTGRDPVNFDNFVQVLDDESDSLAKVYNEVTGTWQDPLALINGSLVVRDSIGAREIVAKAIGVEQLRVRGQDTNLTPNGTPTSFDFDGWSNVDSALTIQVRNPNSSSSAIRSMPAQYCYQFAGAPDEVQGFIVEDVVVEGNDKFRVQFNYAGGGSGISQTFEVRIAWEDADGAFISTSVAAASTSSTSWASYQSGEIVAPTNAAAIRQITVRRTSGASGIGFMTNILVRRMSGSVLIEDGAVIADKLDAEAIYGKRQVISAGDISWVTDPSDVELESELIVWAGESSNATPATRTKQNGVFWIGTDGSYSRNVERKATTIDNSVTAFNTWQTQGSLSHESIGGQAEVSFSSGVWGGSFTSAAPSTTANGTFYLRVIDAQDNVLYEKSAPVTADKVSGDEWDLAFNDPTVFMVDILDDNRNIDKYINRNYRLQTRIDIVLTSTNINISGDDITLFKSLEVTEI